MDRSVPATKPADVGTHEWTCGVMMIAGFSCAPVALLTIAKLLLG